MPIHTPSAPVAPIAIVAGHICLDIIPTIDASLHRGSHLLMPGKLTHIGPAALATGGAVSNTGSALHRLGINTRLMGKIGDDLFGRAILDIVRQRDPQLASGMIIDPTSPSAYTVVLSAPGLDRSFLHCAGANETFCAADVKIEHLVDATLFHFGYPPLMRRLYMDGGLEFADLLSRVKAANLATSLDTAHVDEDSPAGRVDRRQYLNRVLPFVDLFLPSLDEIFFILDRGRFQRATVSASAQHLAVHEGIGLLRDLAAMLLELGVAVVGLKLGDQGIYLRTTSDPARLTQMGKVALTEGWLDRERSAPTFQTQVVGTTGAGDCAVAGFLAAVLRGLDPEMALNAAVGVGAFNVEVADAISGVPTWDELNSRMASGWLRHALQIKLPGWYHNDANDLWYGPTDPANLAKI